MMNKKQLIKVADELGIEHYNECEYYICLVGVNDQSSILYTNHKDNKVVATMKDFADHLKQMGRDSLKMDLNSLLSITQHS